MSKVKIQFSTNLGKKKEIEEKFSNLILNPDEYQNEYALDNETLEDLYTLREWQKILIISTFKNGPKKVAVEQFPTMENMLIAESVKSLVNDVNSIKATAQNSSTFNDFLTNLSDIKYSLNTDTNVTIGQLSNYTKADLYTRSKSNYSQENDTIENIIIFFKNVLELFLQCIEEKKIDAQEFLDACENEVLTFLNNTNCFRVNSDVDDFINSITREDSAQEYSYDSDSLES